MPRDAGEVPAAATPLARRLERELARARAQDLFRTRRVIEGRHGSRIRVDGRSCVNFCSNDYLGLAADPRIADAARDAFTRLGTGSGAAALVSGYNREHAQLEEELAEFTGRPRALLFASGWAANLGVLRALLSRTDTLVADELNHASLIDGGRLSGARYVRVAHGDVAAFGVALSQAAGQEQDRPDSLTLVATDSVFSMDGDLAPLPQLSSLCSQHRAALMIDDAHGFGVLGEGRGILHHHFSGPGSLVPVPDLPQVPGRASPEIYVATLGKALGCAGAFVAGDAALVEFLVQRARTFVFSTAPPPALAAAARCALRVMQQEPQRRARLFANIRRFCEGAAQLGIHLGVTQENRALTPIQPLVIGPAAAAVELSRRLFERGLWVAAIRPPTVPVGTSRLRITLSAEHTSEEIDRLLEALREVSGFRVPVSSASGGAAAAAGILEPETGN